MNILSWDTYLFAEIDGKYGVYTLRELFEIHGKGHRIKVPVLLNERGDKGWVEVEDVVCFEMQPLKRITLARSRLYVEINEDAIIPAYSCELFRKTKEKIILKFKRINELKTMKDLSHNDSLLLTTNIPLFFPEGNNEEWEVGFTLGFWVAEGSIRKRKHSLTKRSLAILTAFARKKEMTLKAYLEHMTDIKEVFLAVGRSDFERGYVDILQKHFKFSKPYKQKHANAYTLRSSDLSLIHLINNYTEGNDSHTKHLKNEAFNRSQKFLDGILKGFLAGDGSFMKKLDRFQVGITTNYRLYNDLIFLAKILEYDIHLQNGCFIKSPSGNYYYQLHLSISKTYHRRTALGLVKEHIKKIEDVGEREAYNLVLKQLYPETDKRAIFNHLFFTAYGFLVSDAVKTLDRSVLSYSLPVPLSS